MQRFAFLVLFLLAAGSLHAQSIQTVPALPEAPGVQAQRGNGQVAGTVAVTSPAGVSSSAIGMVADAQPASDLTSIFSQAQASPQTPAPGTAPATTPATAPAQAPQTGKPDNSGPGTGTAASGTVEAGKEEPKRILGVMANYRAVSTGAIPPPPSAKEAFRIATNNSFDYSAFVFVGLTSLLAEGTDTHPQLGKGIGGFGAYAWRGFLDKTDGNYLVIFLLPTITHEDGRYFELGHGSFVKRALYAGSTVFVTRNYQGHNTFNISEMVGRGASQAISLTYYPSDVATVSGFSSKFAYALGRDALTALVREFWPDINYHVLHRHHGSAAASGE